MQETGRPHMFTAAVRDVAGNPLPEAKLTLEPVEHGLHAGTAFRFDPHSGLHLAAYPAPGLYRLRAEAAGFEPDQREVQVGATEQPEVFILGKQGLPFYYRGNVRVPFESPGNLLAVALHPGHDDKALIEHARQFNLAPIEISQLVRQEGVIVFGGADTGVPTPGIADEHGAAGQRSLADHPSVRLAGPVISLGRDGVTFLTAEINVKFRPHVTEQQVPEIARRYGLAVVRTIPYAGNAFLLRSGEQPSYKLLEICAALVKSGLVVYAEPNLVTTAVPDFVPNDYLYTGQPHLPVINAPGAWNVSTGAPGIVVAVVDDGCDTGHPDFAGKIYSPFNFSTMTANTLSGSHGTKSCGIAAALLNNMEGVAGLAGGCKLMPARYPSAGTDTASADMYVWIAGFNPGSVTPGFPAPISPGADVISNSYGISQMALSGVMKDALDFITTYGRGGKGCVVCFSTGNDNADFTTYRQWANYNKTIAVAASAISPPDAAEVKISTSNFGNRVDVCAPGGGPAGGTEARPLSTTNTGAGTAAGSVGAMSLNYADFGQTSCACPQVAGTAALMLSAHPALTWVEVRQLLRSTAVKIDPGNTDPTGHYVGGYSQWYGYGRINAQAAVQGAQSYAGDRDLVLRDNLADAGLVPTAAPFWASPDLWVRNNTPATDGAAALPANYAAMPPHQNVLHAQDNYVYVQVKNVGASPSFGFSVRVYVAHFPGFEFAYPTNFIPTTHPSDPVPVPMRTGTYLIGEVSHGPLAAGATDIVNVRWPQAMIPPENVMMGGVPVHWHPCLLAEVTPQDGPAPTGSHVWENNNLAQRNLTIIYTDDDAFAVGAVLGNKENRAQRLDLLIDRSQVPAPVRLYVQLADDKVMEALRNFVREHKPQAGAGGCRFTFLEQTRLLLDCSCDSTHAAHAQAVLTLPAGATLELSGATPYNFTLGHYQGKEVVWLAPSGQTRIPVFAGAGALVPIAIGGTGARALHPGTYPITLTQLSAEGETTGALGVELTAR